MLRHISIRFLILIFIIAGASLSCAKYKDPDDLAIFYPPYPEDPKIVYLKSYRGEDSFRSIGFFDMIFGIPPAPRLSQPYGVSSYGDKLFVTQQAAKNIAVIDMKERKIKYFGASNLSSTPMGIAVAADGTIFVAQTRGAVLKFNQNRKFLGVIGAKEKMASATGVAVNNDLGRLYVVDTRDHKIHVFDLAGEKLFEFGGVGNNDGHFFFPVSVAIDRRNGNVVVTDTGNFRVQVLDRDGKYIRKWGQVGDAFGNFSRPKGVAVDTEGHVYVVDSAFENYQVFDEEGQLLIFVGSAGSDAGYFQGPAGIHIDEKDRIFVVDALNGRVQQFQYLSDKWKKENPELYNTFLPK